MMRSTAQKGAGILLFAAITTAAAQNLETLTDSSAWYLSLPEIQSYRTYYLQELESFQQEKQMLILRGISDGEKLLSQNPDPKIVDQILIRLADLQYYKEKDEFLNRVEVYQETLEKAGSDTKSLPPEPVLECRRSMELYQRIIDEFPQSDLVDDAVYNKAFLFEEMGKNREANQIYEYLLEAYPQSKYVPEVHMRLAEFYFNPPLNDIDRAIVYYTKILDFPQSPRYDEALYKLGWSFYRLSKYPEAVSTFTTLIEHCEFRARSDSLNQTLRVDLRNEAIEYIAISFIDFGGPSKMLGYLKKIGSPEWGKEALQKLGDIYKKEKEEYANAVSAYETYLAYAPQSTQAPLIQQNIIESYQLLKDDARLFETRQKMFETYHDKSPWWKNAFDDNAKLKAYQLAEQALRENIAMSMKEAERTQGTKGYERALQIAKKYLESFPEDVYAYMVRWNQALILDTKLHRYKDALREYLTICMVYNTKKYDAFARDKGLATVKDAAENAVIVADSLVRIERRQQNAAAVPPGRREENGAKTKTADPLTTAESWLAMAYDNYIKLFPFDENTPTLLASAGALYYTRNQFNEALKYFNTLVKYFPASPEIGSVKYSILESYFGKQDYESVEVLAKHMLGENLDPAQKEKIRRRRAEALFLQAQQFAESGQGEKAADEYHRMALEEPSVEFADRALFNAGIEYEKLKKYDEAVKVYERLRTVYKGSSLFADALNNLSIDYGETGEFGKAAERYEELAGIEKNAEKARNALYNAIAYYDRAGDWNKAAETGLRYNILFRSAGDADSVFFKAGVYFSKAGKAREEAAVYRAFSFRYPDSPLGVQAAFRLGQLYHDDPDSAEKAFYNAYALHESFRRRKLPGDEFYAAEGLYSASLFLFRRFNSIALKLPQEDLKRSVRTKEQLLDQLVGQFSKAAAFKTRRLPESLFRIGEAYERFAIAWSLQEIPAMDGTSKVMKEREINGRTTQVYAQALTGYGKAAEIIHKVLEEMTAANGVNPPSPEDTLIAGTTLWLSKSRQKITEILYQMAEVNSGTVSQLMGAPIPTDLGELAALEYRRQVLERAVAPVLDIVVEAHRRNLHAADSLGIENAWVQASREKIVSSLSFLGQKYADLALDALSGYRKEALHYKESTLAEKRTPPDAMAASVINFIDIAKSYSDQTILTFERAIQRASGVPADWQIQIQDRLILSVQRIGDMLDTCIREGMKDQRAVSALFESSGDITQEDLLAVIEDNVYFLQQNTRGLLESAVQLGSRLDPKSQEWGWIQARLVRLDPDASIKTYQITVEQLVVVTDTTWVYTNRRQNGWNENQFALQGWSKPMVSGGVRITIPAQTEGNRQRRAANTADSLFFRKEIEIPGIPVTGKVNFLNRIPDRLFLNGVPLSGKPGKEPFDVTAYLREGSNLLALQCSESDPFVLEGAAMIRYIPVKRPSKN